MFVLLVGPYCIIPFAAFTIIPLPVSGYVYSGPTEASDDGDVCKCNIISYSLLSACDACQGSEDWTMFDFPAHSLPSSCFLCLPLAGPNIRSTEQDLASLNLRFLFLRDFV